MVIAQIENENDCSFAIQFADEAAKEKVIEFMKAGLEAWYAAAHPESWDKDYWSKEEVEGFYWDGYAEPTLELMKRNGIEGDCVDIEYDDGNAIADEVVYY